MLKSVLFKGELQTQRPEERGGWKAGFCLSVGWALLLQTELPRPPSLWVCICIFFFSQCTAPKSQTIIFKDIKASKQIYISKYNEDCSILCSQIVINVHFLLFPDNSNRLTGTQGKGVL